jgi:hypothetical protein
VGDDRGFYLFNQWDLMFPFMGGHCFTDFHSFRTADAFNTLLAATENDGNASSAVQLGADGNQGFIRSLDFSGKVLMRSYTQVGSNVKAGFCSLNIANNQSVSGYNCGLPYPNGADYATVIHPVYLKQENAHLRGMMPGMFWILNDNPGFETGSVLSGVTGYPGRQFRVVKAAIIGSSATGFVAFDVTGPWW